MEKEDKRKLVTFERILGEYAVAGAICSYGDVIDFVDAAKQGILIVDTCGHREESGRQMSAFVRKEIENGWGVKGNADEELYNLGQKLRSLQIDKYGKDSRAIDHDDWFNWVSASYVQFQDRDIYLANCLSENLILRKNGLERITLYGGCIDDDKFKHSYLNLRPAFYKFSLNQDEILFMSSDGIHNMAKSLHYDSEDGKIDLDTRHTVLYADLLLYNVINQNFYQSADRIRDELVSKLSQYFLPRTSRDDDITFCVVKLK